MGKKVICIMVVFVFSMLVSTTPSLLYAASEAEDYIRKTTSAFNAVSEVIKAKPTTKETFKSRWKTFQKWYRNQPTEARIEAICSYSTLAQVKLRSYKCPVEASKKLDELYEKAENYLSSGSAPPRSFAPPSPPVPVVPEAKECSTECSKQSMMATIEEVQVKATTKESFKVRWKTFQEWYKNQPKEARTEAICTYSSLAQLKLKFYKYPAEVSRELDELYLKASEFINNR